MYRGASPINWSLINGEITTGNTTILMDTGIDTGDMLMRSEFDISESMTAGELYNLLKINGAELLEETINGIITGKICGVKQQSGGSSYVQMLNKQMANIIKPPGYIIDANNEGITVATNNGILIIEILQLPGGKPLEVK